MPARTEQDFPFDPRARVEKLRALADRELAEHALRLLDCIEGRPAPARPARQLNLPQPARWSSCLEIVA